MSEYQAKVQLLRLYQRTSAKGTEYLSGYMGMARVVGFMGEDQHGKPCWIISVTEDRKPPARNETQSSALADGDSPLF